MSPTLRNPIPAMERRTALSQETFVREYLRPERPVLLQGLFRDAPMMSRWSFDFFRERYGRLDVKVTSHLAGFTQRRTRTVQFGEYLDWLVDDRWREHWYKGYPPPYLERWGEFDPLWGTRWHEVAGDFTLPAYLQNHSRFLPRWLQIAIVQLVFIGPAGTRVWLHQDACKTHFWHVNTTGQKRWVFYAPDQTPYMYSQGGRSPVDCDCPDLERYPLFRLAQPTCEVIQGPGDVVFGPRDWWHQVTSLTSTISLTANFTDVTTTPSFLLDVARQGPSFVKERIMSRLRSNHRQRDEH